MKRKVLLGLLTLVVMAAVGVATLCRGQSTSAEDADLLPAMIQGCKDAVNAVKTGKGTVEVHAILYRYESGMQKALETQETYTVAFERAKYRVSGEILYLKNELGEAGHVYADGTKLAVNLACDGENLMSFEPSLGTGTVGPLTLPEVRAKQGSLAVEATLLFPPNDMGRGAIGYGIQRIDLYPLYEGVTDKGLKIARRERLDGHECIVVERVVEVSRPDGKWVNTREYWIDPERGFAVPRLREWTEGGPLEKRSITLEINTELRDYGNGIWGPAKSSLEAWGWDGKGVIRPEHRYQTTYESDFRLNVPVTADDLTLKLPPDAHMQVLSDKGSP